MLVYPIFFACYANLLVCKEVYVFPERTFTDTDKCNAYVEQIVEDYDGRFLGYPVMMAKCVWHYGDEDAATG